MGRRIEALAKLDSELYFGLVEQMSCGDKRIPPVPTLEHDSVEAGVVHVWMDRLGTVGEGPHVERAPCLVVLEIHKTVPEIMIVAAPRLIPLHEEHASADAELILGAKDHCPQTVHFAPSPLLQGKDSIR